MVYHRHCIVPGSFQYAFHPHGCPMKRMYPDSHPCFINEEMGKAVGGRREEGGGGAG